MPVYEYKGQQYDIADTDPAVAKAKIQAYLGETTTPTPAQAEQKPVTAMEQMFGLGSPLASAVSGAVVKPLMGLNQLLAETGIFGETVKQQARGNVKALEEARTEAKKRVGREGIDFVEIGGALVSPVNRLAPTAAAPTALGRVGQAAGTGVVFGALEPVKDVDNYLEEKLSQMSTGAIAGTVLGGGVEAGKKAAPLVKQLTPTITEEGKKQALREYIIGLTGGEKQKVVEALRNADELVAGSRPTAAEAIADIPAATGLASFQQRLSRSMPEEGIAGQFAQREAQQQAARVGALRQDVAQTPELLDLARTLRESDAARNYGQAFSTTVTADPRLAKIVSNPYVKDALPDAIKLAEARGITAKTDLTQFLQFVKIGLDKQLTRTGDTALSNTEKAAVQQAKKELVNWVGSKNPAFNLARESFAKASQPINQMEIGQFLEQKLGTPLGNKERAGAFATAVQEAASTIKKASGQAAGRQLEDVLTPKQTATVNNILADVSRKAKAEELASRSNIGTLSPESQELPNLLNRPIAIINNILKAVKKDSNAELNRLAAQLLLEPRNLATFIDEIPKSKSKDFVNAFMKKLTPENREIFLRALSFSKDEIEMAKEAAGQLGRTQVLQGITTAGGQE